ncbi:MAG: tRNA (guanosine(46)-N7)-methyltransferase TrmB [Lachnospiraceae bacterium]|nr:tRNA (guanosine(46)-N7)-methyltransferase TrmB [Lachnospiraceae bacterium]
MRLRNIKRAASTIENSEHVIHEPRQMRGNWTSLFGNNNPIHLEIGMGKGRFLHTLAKLNPDINYVGMEKFQSVLLRAVELQDADMVANQKFVCDDARFLEEFFAPCEVERIYLNFSDPWPKERHARRRLTSPEFLNKYLEILPKDGLVIFKTDNKLLFDYSVETAREFEGFEIVEVNYDLHHSEGNEGNIMTEYEEKFSSQGNLINRMILKKK